MATKTDVFNIAFLALGQEPINDAETDTSQRATIARIRFPVLVDAVLREHPWNCARFLDTIARDTDKPKWGWGFQFTLPTNPFCLRVLQVDTFTDWQIFAGRKLFTSSDAPLNIDFIGRIDVSLMDAILVDAVSDRLASELAFAGIGSREIAADRLKTFDAKSSWARTIDGQEGKPGRIFSRALIEVRRGGGANSTAGPIDWMNR